MHSTNPAFDPFLDPDHWTHLKSLRHWVLRQPILEVVFGKEEFDDLTCSRDHEFDFPTHDLSLPVVGDRHFRRVFPKGDAYPGTAQLLSVIVVVQLAKKNHVSGVARAASRNRVCMMRFNNVPPNFL